ncbi:MAG: DUF5050 domain-containing protein [Clostridia bacterium]|nr:DUF5050 domain-containing protein [Clostridia bacterium]
MNMIVKAVKNFKNYKKKDQLFLIRIACLFLFAAGLIIAGLIWLCTLIFTKPQGISPSSAVKYKNSIYYYSPADCSIMKYDCKSGVRTFFSDYANVTDIIIVGKKMYFTGEKEHRGIYTADLKTGQTELLIQTDCKDLFVRGNTMVYLCDGQVFMADAKGKFRRPVAGNQATSLVFDGKNVYFGDLGGLSKFNVKERTTTVLNPNASACYINLYGKTLYYYNSTSKCIESIGIDGKKLTKIADAECGSLRMSFSKKILVFTNDKMTSVLPLKGKNQTPLQTDIYSPVLVSGKYIYSCNTEGNLIATKLKSLI